MSFNNLIEYAKEKGLAKVYKNEPMKNHTSMRVGGFCDVYLEAVNMNCVREIFQFCIKNNISCKILGNGSNTLFRDEGFSGCVVRANPNSGKIEVDGNTIYSDSNVSLCKIANTALMSDLTGFEFAHGIPGTLGGGVYINAGAYGPELRDVVVKTIAMDAEGKLLTFEGEEHNFGYRHSVFCDNKYCIIGSEIKLEYGDRDKIRARMDELDKRRHTNQPLEFPSCGSVFKRPEGHYAGRLIEEAGLKGRRVGGACVSTKHAGFIINTGNATTKDVLDLVQIIQNTVKEKFGIELQTEVEVV